MLAGAGCGKDEQVSTPASSDGGQGSGISDDNVPPQARYWNLRTPLLTLQSREITAIVTAALEVNPDFVLLRERFRETGYPFEPEPSNYVALHDASGTALVGFSYHTRRADGTYGVLVSVYSGPDRNGVVQATFTYMTEVNYQSGLSTLSWADGSDVRTINRRKGG